MDINKWHRHFLKMALTHGSMSKDPETRVGCIVVDSKRAIRAAGFNGFPIGIEDTALRLVNRELKLQLMVHAEMNAIILAGRAGISLEGCTMYVACTDDTKAVWAGPPCTRCAMSVIQSGIDRVVYYPMKQVSKWREDLEFAAVRLEEAGVLLQEVTP